MVRLIRAELKAIVGALLGLSLHVAQAQDICLGCISGETNAGMIEGMNASRNIGSLLNNHARTKVFSSSQSGSDKNSKLAPFAGTQIQPQEVAKGRAAFFFKRSPAITAKVQHAVIDSVTKVDPTVKADLEKALSDDRMFNEFSKVVARHDFSSTNVVDVLASYYLASWEIVTGGDSDTHPRGIRATRDKLAQAMQKSPKLVALSNDQKQQFAEELIYHAELSGAAMQEATKTGNQAAIQQLRASVRKNVMELGPDLQTLKLTDDGLVPKS